MFTWASYVGWSKMQRLQFSLSWLQTTEVSFTCLIDRRETHLCLREQVKIFLTLNHIYPPPAPIINFWKSFQLPPPQLFQPPRLFGIQEYNEYNMQICKYVHMFNMGLLNNVSRVSRLPWESFKCPSSSSAPVPKCLDFPSAQVPF